MISKIRQLPPNLVNQIAAGEVLERPAAAVKELVENAIDADARQIDITIAEGGKNLITVADDGIGMSRDELPLALSRHATSKLPSDDLLAIHSLGFRGEALPSIAAVARLTMTSRKAEDDHGWSITVTAGEASPIIPAARQRGTLVDVRDLFFATPARLKFMKSTRVESEAIQDVVSRLALAYPNIGFTLSDEGRVKLRLAGELGEDHAGQFRPRMRHILGAEFADNALELCAERDGIKLTGFAGLPSFNRSNTAQQYLFVNGRPVKDRLLLSCVRVAYGDTMPSGRHPVLALFISLPASELDVNVHPTKAEIRFRQPAIVRSLLITGIGQALIAAGHRASSTGGDAAVAMLEQNRQGQHSAQNWPRGGYAPNNYPRNPPYRPHDSAHWQAPIMAGAPYSPALGVREKIIGFRANNPYDHSQHNQTSPQALFSAAPMAEIEQNHADDLSQDAEMNFPLGAARAQLHNTYIISETPNGVILVDQHAAHERLVYENLKAKREAGGIARQALLIPDIVELPPAQAQILLAYSEELAKMGVVVEEFGIGAVVVREIPAQLSRLDLPALVRDLAIELMGDNDGTNREKSAEIITDRLNKIAASIACHGSVRAGQRLSAAEMNGLLREMEATPLSGQCNHGRPTWIELKKTDLERLFARR